MSKSQRLSQREIREGFRLLGETCEVGADPIVWRAHLLAGVCRLVGAAKGFADEEIVGLHPRASGIVAGVARGLDSADEQAGFVQYLSEGGFHIHPFFPVIQPIANKPWTRRRAELVEDHVYDMHRVVNDYQRPADMYDTIHSRQPIPLAGWSNLVTVFRGWNDRPFSERERRLVHLVHEELGRLWHRPPPPDPADALPPRLGQVVRRFRAGDSEKQVALHLGLTRQTVHAYAKELHRRFGVSSRFDLLAHVAPPPTPFRPRLGFEVIAAQNAATFDASSSSSSD